MARGGAISTIPAATVQAWTLQAQAEQRRAARLGKPVLTFTVRRRNAGQTHWHDVNKEETKFAEAVYAAQLILPGDSTELTDIDGATYRVMAF